MRVCISDEIDLKKIADSGQCFRMNECDGGFSVASGSRHVFIRHISDDSYEFECSQKEFDEYWRGYFDLDLGYEAIRKKIRKSDDEYLYNAASFGKGIRMLRQDPWEMLISFIISQRKNIPAIKASIEKLCAMAGKEIARDERYGVIYSFPTPEELAALTLEDLGKCSLGYRDKYVFQAARDVLSGAVDLKAWGDLPDEELREKLLSLFGVGIKVANCEILFGYHRLDSFPVDVWINRVLEKHYPGGFPFETYAPYNGIMQQYLFFYSRFGSL